MATHSSVLAWRIPGTGSLVGCRLWGRTESDATEATQQQQQQQWGLKIEWTHVASGPGLCLIWDCCLNVINTHAENAYQSVLNIVINSLKGLCIWENQTSYLLNQVSAGRQCSNVNFNFVSLDIC